MLLESFLHTKCFKKKKERLFSFHKDPVKNASLFPFYSYEHWKKDFKEIV